MRNIYRIGEWLVFKKSSLITEDKECRCSLYIVRALSQSET